MFSITVPIQEIADQLQAARDEIDRAEPIILHRVADKLIELLNGDFAAKSSGGAGAGGVTWKKNKEDNGKPIGVESGEMKRRLQQIPQGTGVEILFAASWARHFDKSRTLIPDPLPPNWFDQLDRIVAEISEQVVVDVLEGR